MTTDNWRNYVNFLQNKPFEFEENPPTANVVRQALALMYCCKNNPPKTLAKEPVGGIIMEWSRNDLEKSELEIVLYNNGKIDIFEYVKRKVVSQNTLDKNQVNNLKILIGFIRN